MRHGTSLALLLMIGLFDMAILGILILYLTVGVEVTAMGQWKELHSGDPKYVALTFDDGPNREYTKILLDGLKARNVKASFFLLGKCIPGNEELVKLMDRDGHLIGVHGMDHRDLAKEKPEYAVKQIAEAGEMIREVTGKEPDYMRPPYGSWNENLEEAVGKELLLVPVFWDVDSLDWKLQDSGKIVKKVLKDVENGEIILLHDEFAASVEAAFQIIDKLRAKGYTFVTVDELMVD